VIALALIALSGAACEKKTAPPTATPPEVLVVTAGTRDVPVHREWVGTLDGSENAEIRARVNGYLLKRHYQEGTLVKKGDLPFEIDPRPMQAALAEAKSQLEQAKAMQLASAAEAARSEELFKKQAISAAEHTNKTQLNESNVAKIAALEANVRQSELNLEFCRVVSPVEGVAGISTAQLGDLVGSTTVLTSVSTLDPMKVVFPISEVEYLASADKTQTLLTKPLEERAETLELILADGKTFPHKARLLSVDRQVNASGTILVTALVKNPGSTLRPGLFVRARLVAQTLEGAVVVPQRAVLEVQGSYQLGIVTPEGKAELRPVTVGPRTGREWVITSGLKAGENVVVEGVQKLRQGAPVVAMPWSAAPAAEPQPTASK
jgi:membrane fusion protein, multidrug efflux system